jgi:hypothetical protein
LAGDVDRLRKRRDTPGLLSWPTTCIIFTRLCNHKRQDVHDVLIIEIFNAYMVFFFVLEYI